MRNIYKTLVMGAVAISLSSCGNSWLNLDPSDGIDANKAITDVKSADVALTGIYDGLQGSSSRTTYYAASMFSYGDVRGEDMQSKVLSSRGASFYEMKYTEDNAPQMWSVQYNVILRANRLLEAIEQNKIAGATVEQLKKYESEALAVRALVHFDLCRVYGAPYDVNNAQSYGIPIVLKPISVSEFRTRNTVEEVYSQVISDLEQSLNIGGLTKAKNYGYVNEWFVKGLLAKINLYKGDNAKALEYAEDVIKNSPYELWTTDEYVDGWKTSSTGRKEMIFEIINKSIDDWSDREGIANLMSEDGYSHVLATKAFIDLLAKDPKDVRNQILLPATSKIIDGEETSDLVNRFGKAKIFVNKFPKDESGEWRLNSLPILRLSEVYLIAAEAAAKTSKSDVAAKYLNTIQKRANPEAADITAANATLERISIERRKELVGEGNRFFDAMRNNEKVVRYTNEADKGFHNELSAESRSFDRTYYRTLLPIPIAEVNVNSAIAQQQNPGY